MSTLRLSNGLTGLHRRPYILDAIVLTDNSQSPTDQRPQSRKLPHKEGIALRLFRKAASGPEQRTGRFATRNDRADRWKLAGLDARF